MIRSLTLCLFLFSAVGQAGTPQNIQRYVLPDDTRVQIWTETDRQGTQSFYEIQHQGVTHRQVADYAIPLRHGSFDPSDSVPPPLFESLESGPNQNLYIVQFHTQILAPYLEDLKKLGALPRYFVPNYAQVVQMTPEIRDRVENLPHVRWVGPFHPAYRLEEFLLVNADQAEAVYPRLKYNIMILDSHDQAKNNVANRIRKLGGVVDRADAGKFLLEATLTYDQLFQVVGWDEVLFIDRWSAGGPDMDKAREIGGANYIETVEGFTGQGVRAEVLDIGFNTSHVDFAHHPLIEHTAVVSDSHGAACSGINFGDGTANPLGRGMLPDAQGIVAGWNVVSTGTPRYTHTGELVQAPYFAVFQTSSVGSDRTTQYTTISADTDAALFDFDILHCQSQSNAGDQMSRPQAWAKNVLSGGAVNHQDTLTRADDCWCGGASIGPATDGRIKPDLSSFYDSIFTTTTGSTTAYTSGFGGTSGATPIICGHAGIVFQMWHEGIFGNETNPKATVFENRCHMTTAKALLINTAYRYDFSGQNHDLTRTHQGWGMPDLRRLHDRREQMIVVDEEDVITPLSTNAYTAHVVEGTPEFNATMIFADPAGNPAASVHRINNLDLRVTSPSGVVYWGNQGLRDGNWSTPDGSANTVDTVECVFVQNPEAGAWTVDVIGTDINQDAHVETPQLDADYALVVSGAIRGPGFGIATASAGLATCIPDTLQLTLNITQQLNYTESVTLSASGVNGAQVSFSQNPVVPPATVTVTINPTQVTPGVYTLTLMGTSVDQTKNLGLALMVASQNPAVPTGLAPANGASEVSGSPEFSWTAATQASSYTFELAADADFTQILETETITDTSLASPRQLDSLTCYYWRVRAHNACGDSDWASGGFTTQEQANYFTQQFTSGFDLGQTRLRFVPNGGGDYYTVCRDTIAALPTSPTGGTTLALTDDSSLPVTPSQALNFYGVSYGTVHVGSNGFLTFGAGDNTASESLSAHFNIPRISLLFDDLNPPTGTVTYRELADRLVISWVNVPEYQTTNSNTFQAELFFNGEIHLSWLTLQAADGIAGLSRGGGQPSDFVPTDLSASGDCAGAGSMGPQGCRIDQCAGDLNEDGVIDAGDLSLTFENWSTVTPTSDINGDGIVNLLDLLVLMGLYGDCP